MNTAQLVVLGILDLILIVSFFIMLFSGEFFTRIFRRILNRNLHKIIDEDPQSDLPNTALDASQKEQSLISTGDKFLLPLRIRFFFVLCIGIIYTYFGFTLFAGLGLSIDAVKTNYPLGNTYLILFALTLCFLIIYLVIDLLVPMLKSLFTISSKLRDSTTSTLELRDIAQHFIRNKLELLSSLLFGIGSILLFLSSQILLWIFIV